MGHRKKRKITQESYYNSHLILTYDIKEWDKLVQEIYKYILCINQKCCR